jgi:hypothetical protein
MVTDEAGNLSKQMLDSGLLKQVNRSQAAFA